MYRFRPVLITYLSGVRRVEQIYPKYHLTDEKEASHESATLEAKGRNYGIGSWPMDYSHAGWAVRLIDEPSYPEPGQAAAIPPVTGSPEENLVVIMDLS